MLSYLFTCLLLTACKISNKSNKRLMRYCTFIFSISCSIASVTSYFIEKRLKIYKMATSLLLKFLTLKWNISRTIWRIEVGDGSLFCIFHALSFEFNFFFDRRFSLSYHGWPLLDTEALNKQFTSMILNHTV